MRSTRADEDWSVLLDASRHARPTDAIKAIPLTADQRAWLTIGGEGRWWWERYANENWGRAPQDDDGYLLQRYGLHAGLRLGSQWRLFAELKSALESGRTGGPRRTDEDRLDAHQAFIEFTPGGAQGALQLRLGRQELNYGSARLVTMRDGPNVRQSFQGARAAWSMTSGRTLDAFYAREVETEPGVFDDGADKDRTLWGVYFVGPAPLLSDGGRLDLYYFGIDRADAVFRQGVADERRHSLGVRVWNRGEPLDYNVELVYQFGDFGEADIRAWTIASEAGYTLERWRMSPRVSLKANVTSGDEDPQDGKLETFNALYPRGNYFGRLTTVGPYNHRDLQPALQLQATSALSIEMSQIWFWRDSTHDAVYGVPGNILRSAVQSDARYVGRQLQIEVRYEFGDGLALSSSLGRFFAGEVIKQSPPSQDVRFAAAWLSYRF